MMMVNVSGVPLQLLRLGVTVIRAVSARVTLAAVKLRLPVPEVGKPMAGLSFTQVNTAPAVPVKLAVTGVPPQAFMLAG